MTDKKAFIFLTYEGNCQSPNYELNSQEIENLQVIGWADGDTVNDSLKRLLEENKYLSQTGFSEIFAFELAPNFLKSRRWFSLSDHNLINSDS